MSDVTHTTWSDFSNTAMTGFTSYTPGKGDITNLGLLQNRAVLARDGTGTQSASVSDSSEETFLSTPSLANAVAAYGGATLSYLQLPAMSKSFPGYEDAPTWTVMTDDPDEKVGRTYVGKPEKVSTIEYTLPANLDLKEILDSHCAAGSLWTLMQCYDDTKESKIYYIIIPHCKILGVAGNNGENNSAAEITLKFQPEGGIYVPAYLSTLRVTSST